MPAGPCLIFVRQCLHFECDLKAPNPNQGGPVIFFLHYVNHQRPNGRGEPVCDLRDGGARRDRTDDLMLAKHALYQLSYGPEGR